MHLPPLPKHNMGSITVSHDGAAVVAVTSGVSYLGVQDSPTSPRGFRRIQLASSHTNDPQTTDSIESGCFPAPFPTDVDLLPLELKIFPRSSDGLVRALCWLPGGQHGHIHRATITTASGFLLGVMLPMAACQTITPDQLVTLLDIRDTLPIAA